MDWETPIWEACHRKQLKEMVGETENHLKKKWLRISRIKASHKSTAWKHITGAREDKYQ